LHQAVLVQAALLRGDFLCGDGALFQPAIDVADQVIDRRAIGLVFHRFDQPPFSFLPAELDSVIPVLDRDAFEVLAIEVYDIAGLTLSLGLRYEFYQPEKDTDGFYSFFLPSRFDRSKAPQILPANGQIVTGTAIVLVRHLTKSGTANTTSPTSRRSCRRL
jgi:hypothetical protein